MEGRECPICKRENEKSVEMIMEYDGSKFTCPLCGYEIKNKKKKTIKQKLICTGLILGCLVLAIVFFFSYQRSLISDIKMYYSSGNYEHAKEIMDKLYIKNGLEDYSQKIEILANATKWRRIALDEEPHNEFYGSMMAATIAVCIADYDVAVELGIGSELENIMMMTAQDFANEGYDVSYWLYQNRDDINSKNLEPLRTENIDRVNELIEKVVAGINKQEVEQKSQERIEEAQQEYNKEHPIQIANDDCTITKDGNYYHCNGTVHNVSEETHYYVKVKITYYDENEDVLTTDWTYAVDSVGIDGGENQQFEITSKVEGSVEFYKVEILEWL